MTQIDCVDCLKTYRPSKYGDALGRVLMYGFIEEFEDERPIRHIFHEHLHDENWQRWLMNRIKFFCEDKYFSEAFNFYYEYCEKRHRQTISASFLCFDCEQYYCTNCVTKHSGHFTFSKDDKFNMCRWGRINQGMLDTPKVEVRDRKVENARREHTFLCDIVGVRCKQDKAQLNDHLQSFTHAVHVPRFGHRSVRPSGHKSVRPSGHKSDLLHDPDAIELGDMCILHDEQKWLITDYRNYCIKIFDINNNRITRRIKLSSQPKSSTEIPSTDPSQSLIAVSFSYEEQIEIMNIRKTPAKVVSSIKVQGRCYDLAYCNNKLITCSLYCVDDTWVNLVRVMDMSGQIINVIHLKNLSDIKSRGGCMSVHSESETIYVCHGRDPSCVIGLSLDGQVLHSVTFTDLEPRFIHVDKDQNVYVMGDQLPIYKLSADLSFRERIIDKDVGIVPVICAMRFHNDKFYLVSNEGHTYIIQYDSSHERGQRDNGDRITNDLFNGRPMLTGHETKFGVARDMCILNDEQSWVVVDVLNTCIKVFNVDNNKITCCIKLSSKPHGIIEIPSTDHLQSLIAVSFPDRMEVDIMNIHKSQSQAISSINALGSCYDLAYCNNKLITRCWDLVVSDVRDAIHVMDISGQMIKVIHLHKLPGIKKTRVNSCRVSVHSESERIFICHRSDPSCVISLSLDGQVLHSVTFTDLEPTAIHVDNDQNVYVADNGLPIYKLSADLRFRERVIDKDVGKTRSIKAMRLYNDMFYLVSDEGYVYIIQHDSSHEHVQREDGLSTKKFTE